MDKPTDKRRANKRTDERTNEWMNEWTEKIIKIDCCKERKQANTYRLKKEKTERKKVEDSNQKIIKLSFNQNQSKRDKHKDPQKLISKVFWNITKSVSNFETIITVHIFIEFRYNIRKV
jgi:hypothetical protein